MINKTAVLISSGDEVSGIGKYSKQLGVYLKNNFKSVINVNLNNRCSRIEINNNLNNKKLIYLKKIPFEPAYLFYWRCRNILNNNLGDIFFISNEKISLINVRPKIVTCHDLIMFKYPRNLLEIVARKYMYSYLYEADKILCDSKSTIKDLKDILHIDSKKLILFYPKIDKRYSRKEKEKCLFLIKKYKLSNNKKILFVGSEEPRKNIETLLKIYKELLKYGNYELIKIGKSSSYASRSNTFSLIKSLGLEGKVKILENIPEQEMPFFYSLVDVFVFPSKYEGFGYPLLEALSCGCPIVTANNSSLMEIVGNSAFKLDCMDINGFVNKILAILNEEKLRNIMIKNSLERARQFNKKEYKMNFFANYE